MREEIVAQIAAQRADLLAYLQRVDDAGWTAPTACTRWTVKDVLAHLVEGELWTGRVYRREQTHVARTDPERGIATWSALPGVAVRAALWQHGTATQRVLEQMTDETWQAPIDAFGCTRMGRLARLHLFEMSVHGHDITDALSDGSIWEPYLGFLTAFAVRAAPVALARRGVTPEAAAHIRCGDLQATIDGRGEAWILSDEAAPATVESTPEDLLLLVTGRRSREDTTLKIEGDEEVAERVLAGWRLYEPGA